MDTETAHAPVETAPAPAATEAAPVAAPADPFQVDEAVLATLSPESRTAVEPLMQGWRKTATETLSKERESGKSHQEKAQALDRLVQDPRFVSWYNQEVNGIKPAVKTDVPQERKPIVTPQEWTDALTSAANGDPSKYEDLNRKIAESATQPALNAIARQQKELSMSIELDNVFRKYPDAKELDSIRIGDEPNAPTLFEMALYYVHDLKKQPMESAYKAAKSIHDAVMAKANKTALGMVEGKKASVTESAPTSTKEDNVQYADSPEQVLREQIKAGLAGRKVQVMLRKK